MVTSVPLIELLDIKKWYGGDSVSEGKNDSIAPRVDILRGISLTIHAGEFVAIVGASGSGKSTLMYLLGCLGYANSGVYRFEGRDIATMNADELARLRREAFGFVFQGYHLIVTESAQENVEVPAIYAGMPALQRHTQSQKLLQRLGLGERMQYRPNQLSGGQQQRVSIARALINGGRIILADEPTGALDTHSGQEVMVLLHELAAQGHTIILITHDHGVAQQARRIIELRDGQIVSDSSNVSNSINSNKSASENIDSTAIKSSVFDVDADRRQLAFTTFAEACRAAWRVLWIHRFRTALTLLGIVIGVASVIIMLAIGLGTRQQIVAQLGAFGTNLIYVSSVGESSRIPGRSITLTDLEAIAELPNVAQVLPNVTGNKVVRHGNIDLQTYIRGTSAKLPKIQMWALSRGMFFSAEDDRDMANVAVLGHKLTQTLMPDIENPVGQRILIGDAPFEVIGVMKEKGALSGDRDDDDLIFVPFSTAGIRLFGQREPTYTVLAVDEVERIEQTQAALDALLFERHGMRDFSIGNAAASIETEAKTQDSMTLMLSLIAAISLIVGGIGVMNVMLMTVRERTREIGIRMATGARQSDILRQFLTEAMLVSLIGGLLGVVAGVVIGIALMVVGVPMVFSVSGMLGAFFCALATGLLFGYMPARRAAQLDPVVALGSD